MSGVGYFLRRAAREHRDRPAITGTHRSLTYGEVIDRATRLGNALRARGLEAGDHVAVVAPNCIQNMEIEFACALAGLVRVSLNARLADAELLRTMERMDAKAVIYAGRRAALVEAATESIPGLTALRLVLGEEDHEARIGDDYETALQAASARPADAPGDDERLYCLFCSSGTTGEPKGVMVTHRAQTSVALNLLLEFGPVRPGDGVLLPQPLSHGAGFFMLPYFMSGGHCVVVEVFDPVGAFETAERHQVETIKLVPTMLHDMLNAGVAPTESYAPKRIIYGASPISREQAEVALERFGPVLAQTYGQAEAPMCISVLHEEDHLDSRTLLSAGRPWRGLEVRVVDAEGRDTEPDEPGEVIVRGPHVTRGYYKDPESTARILRDGYLHTNDRARIDERGFLHLLGRMDDVINSGGFTIPARVVENVIDAHPDVVEVAVRGIPHEKWGEVVSAFVVLRDGAQLTDEELVDYCRPRLGIQRPRIVRFVEDLPRNAYGKVVKSELPVDDALVGGGADGAGGGSA
jgi:acyl-CoA synthetase (AMP-forming)/AMP-acid ligase II